jgi:S-adenosylmethionine:tRNA ribosyltransferase-isomerase
LYQVDVRDFDFDLPSGLIAQEPSAEPTAARLLHLSRENGAVTHATVAQVPRFLRAGDLLVVNNTRVFPARLIGRRVPTGGLVECLLIGRIRARSEFDRTEAGPQSEFGPIEAGPTSDSEVWEALMHPGQKLKPGSRVLFEGVSTLYGEVLQRHFYGRRTIRLWTDDGSDVSRAVDAIGHVPLPPYIKRPAADSDRDRYQTMFARTRGSVAAPTAGLHFTPALLHLIAARGVEITEVTLHVGYGTFQPVRVDRVEEHRLEAERYEVCEAAAASINRALDERRRVIAVGTTTTRTLEALGAAGDGRITAGTGAIDLFIYPGFAFTIVTGLLTNFHLPRSSLLMLVSAFAGRERVLAAYHAAIGRGYRFYSYGDAMLIL